VLDLDNTLWGGIIGQDGMEGIILGEDGLGRAYEDFQREILKLHEKGIILAICSKNNESDALEVFRKHKGMILKEESFVSKRINWTDKVTNILEISKEINIGLDDIVFFDDNPAERKWVRDNLPQVIVPEFPEDPFLYTEFLKSSDWFDSYRLNKEDISRNTTYKAVAKGMDLKITSKSVSNYLKALDQQIILEEIGTSALSRATQLCQKTNQFNLTTKRYQLTEIKEMTENKNNRLYTISAQDCFCDYGIVGLLILKEHESTVLIDTFILSCRIVGRKIEFAVIEWLKEMYKRKDFHHIEGIYEETAKNALCKDFYKDGGFEFVKKDNNAFVYLFSFSRKDKAFPFKKLIKVKALAS
jgi:FkbH-like protein